MDISISDIIEAEQYLLETIASRTTLVDEALTIEERLDYIRTDLEMGRDKGFFNFGLITPDGIVHSTDGSVLDSFDTGLL